MEPSYQRQSPQPSGLGQQQEPRQQQQQQPPQRFSSPPDPRFRPVINERFVSRPIPISGQQYPFSQLGLHNPSETDRLLPGGENEHLPVVLNPRKVVLFPIPKFSPSAAKDQRKGWTSYLRPYGACLYIGTFFFAVTLCYAILTLTQSFVCLGPPYLYITHKNGRNIMKFSRDGCLMHEKVLWGINNEQYTLRSMIFGKFHEEEVLYVSDTKSEVLMFGKCFDQTSLRPFLSSVVSFKAHPGANHAYGISVDHNDDLYISFQNTDVILRFHADTFLPIENEKTLQSLQLPSEYYEHHNIANNNNNIADKKKDKKSGSDNDNDDDDSEGGEGDKGDKSQSTTERRVLFWSQYKQAQRQVYHLRQLQSSPSSSTEENNNSTNTIDSNNNNSTTPVENDNKKSKKKKDKKKDKKQDANKKDNQEDNKVIDNGGGEEDEEHQHVYYNGTFVQFGLPEKHDPKERGIRAIQWTKNFTELWIANEDLNAIIIVNREGKYLHHIDIPKPIGLYYHLPEIFHHPPVVDTIDIDTPPASSKHNKNNRHNTTATGTISSSVSVDGNSGNNDNKRGLLQQEEGHKDESENDSDDDDDDQEEDEEEVNLSSTSPIPLPDTKINISPNKIINDQHIIFVGSKDKVHGGIHAVDIHSYTIVKAYQSIGLTHPAGIVAYKDTLFVADQSRNAVVTFNMTTMRIIKMIIPSSRLHGRIEQITLSEC